MSNYDPGRSIPQDPGVTSDDWLKARDIAREHLHRDHGDAARWRNDADRIRRVLALPSYRGHMVKMKCFNEQDVREIERRLTPDERARVRFTWLVFGAKP